MKSLGGEIVDSIHNCTHLVTDQVQLFLYLMSVSVLFSYLIPLVRCVLLGRLESQIVPLRKLLGAEKLHKPGVIDMQS